jgi:hypothetical protein
VSAIDVEYVSVRTFVQKVPLELKLLEGTELVDENAEYATPTEIAAPTTRLRKIRRLIGSAPAR